MTHNTFIIPCLLSVVLFYTTHPKAKLFLSHGGSHGIYEGICNAVPMVMMPLFWDQPGNVDYMVARGVAAEAAAIELTPENQLEALNKFLKHTRAVVGGKVLVMPADGSHWLSMKLLVQELVVRGHEVVVLVPATSLLIKSLVDYRVDIYPASYTKEDLDNTFNNLKDTIFIKQPSITDKVFVNIQIMTDFISVQVKGCESLLYNPELVGHLRGERFDVVLTDPYLPCGSILAESFSVPVVYFHRGLPCGLGEAATQCPSPPSYVPRSYSGNLDTMTFPQRVKNMVLYMMESVSCHIMYARFDEMASRYLEKDITYKDLISHGAIWLLRYDFTFLFPKPLMPNMVLIGGINCVEPAPLPADLQEFVDSSGDDGFIVFTLGSMVDKMPADLTKVFLDAFSKISQRVVWRHTGILPDNVPKKVKIMKWLPQNDLLSHPKAKLFLSHGGSHGIYEGICNAVPMVIMPLFSDQIDNVKYMVARGVASELESLDLTTEKLLEALNKVLNDTSYREKMVKLSAVHQDRAVKPLDLAVFWTEFVMRHKGADHLRPAAHRLNFLQYHSLDTICFLVVILMTIAFLVLKCGLFCACKCAHPKAKLFLSHGGSHGLYEGICNVVPMVIMPLFADQLDSVNYMVACGVASELESLDLTTEKLLEPFNKVLNDTSHKEKMVKLSAVHQDRAIKPLDLAVFWTQFIIRHKGAHHLLPAAHHLNL
ncbi:hypothetical protein NHX12_007225 [Muraenolepis orangiensis]|uniref:glucuronosyltransferase n=1 Tax=Muraenolepis orangiensis TaxID=630683 RepID=A0A9Q0DQY2_9TELE|nr:hypothetical protein NHX12_007225 [Muraenolepis orangiensis]